MTNTLYTTDGLSGVDISTLLDRITAARAGYLDNLNQAGLLQLTAARAGYLDELAAANLPTDIANNLTAIGANATSLTTLSNRLTAARAGYLDHLNRDRPDMIFPSVASSGSIIVLPAAAADLDFPDVVVSGLPSGITIAKSDLVVVIGALFDTSSSENQIDQASKTIRVKVSTGSWGTDDIIALTFANNGLQCDGDAYRGGALLSGATDIKSVVTADGTYNFRSEETNRGEGVTVTGATLELLDVSMIIRVWFN